METSYLNQARALMQRGQMKPARAAYRKAVEVQPRNVDLLIEAAVADAQSGQFKPARRLLEKALKLKPDDANIYLNLGEVAREAGALDPALRHYRKAAGLAPDDPDILYALGDLLRERGDTAEAHDILSRAAALAPNDAEISNALGIVCEARGEIGDAITAYQRATATSPGYRDAWGNLGQALYHVERFEEAISAFDRAQTLSGGSLTNLLVPWAKALVQLGRFDEALAKADDALASGSERAAAQSTKGMVQQQLGDFDAAEAAFRSALADDPKIGEAYEKLALMKRLDADAAAQVERVLDDETADRSSRSAAGFALYRLRDRTGDTKDAFAALAQANAFKAETLRFDAEQHNALCDRIIDTFDADFFAQRQGQGHDSVAPIFILGMPRSGTTLTEQILATYDEVKPCGERQDFQDLARSLEDYPTSATTLADTWARDEGERILDLMFAGDDGIRFVTNKSPGNYALIGLIAWVFPNAKIIYCKRDPRDIGLSSFEQNFRSGLSYTYDLSAFAAAYRAHERLMAHWMAVSPIPIHTVTYEDMARDPEAVAKPMIAYCGLDWRERSLATQDVDRPIGTASVWQVRQPINAGSVGKWRRYERELAPMIDALGL